MAKKKKGRHSSGGSPAARGPNPKANGKASVPPPSEPPESAEGTEREAEEGEQEAAASAVAEAADGPPSSPASAPAPAPISAGAAWGQPIARFEKRWTYYESRLITFVLVWQLFALVAWVFLAGLSSPVSSGNSAGLVFRAVAGSIGFGLTAWMASRSQTLTVRRVVAIGGIALGIVVAPLWRSVGVDYFDNVKGWLQEGSTLTLMGGLRGLATRLTLWLALLGGSLATAAGKHIHIDVIFRFLPPRLRIPAGVVNFLAAAMMCFLATWGFIDHIAIESFGAKAEDTAGTKVSLIGHHMGEHFFLTRKQIGLDLRTLPRVVTGDRYDRWMSATQWNEWVKDAGFESHYTPEQVQTILVPEVADAAPHSPTVIAPDGDTSRGILVHDLNLVFPFGMFVIGLRFLIRALLALSGHINLDPDAAHKPEMSDPEHEASAVGTAEKGSA